MQDRLLQLESFAVMPGTSWSGVGKPKNGETIKAIAEKSLGKKLAKEHFKDQYSTAVVEGEVLDCTDARKLQVSWSHPGGQTVGKHNQRVLIGSKNQGAVVY